MGVGAGVLGLTGIYVLIGFFVALFVLSWVYYSKILSINEDEFGQNELFMEGVGNAFGLFLVSLDYDKSLSFHGYWLTHLFERNCTDQEFLHLCITNLSLFLTSFF